MAKKKKANRKPQRLKPKGPSQAEAADRYVLYQRSVQAPDVDVEFFADIYRDNFDAEPLVLREDFCGAAAVCCEWVKVDPERQAFGIDLDPEPLAWGAKHNLSQLDTQQKNRVQLVLSDVRAPDLPPADIVAAQNFSYCIFKTRSELKDYFKKVYDSLGETGCFITDLFGGYDSLKDEHEDISEYPEFDYIWEQHAYDPINAHGIYKIHFNFKDGSKLRDAFTYDWRLWTIPEIRDLMKEVGFAEVDVYWENEDPESGEGTGTYSIQVAGESDPAWNAYIVGMK